MSRFPKSVTTLATMLFLMGVVVGCDEPKKPARKIQSRETVGKTTQEVRNLKTELAKGGQKTDGKIHATDYITIQADAYKTSVANIAKLKIKMDMEMYAASNDGKKPETYEEFMDLIIKKGKPDGIQLPMLPFYQEYGYDPETKELVVIEYPKKKKEFDEQWDKEVGRK
jgi:lipopolysaccharide export LptBFGC system permease protein LptF